MQRFPLTRLSVVERIRAEDLEVRRVAFGDLVEGYWKPVYTHLRMTWQLSAEDAQDLTQGFFAETFDKAWLERFDPAKARFRTFVRVCVDRYVMNVRQAEARLKRGGGVTTIPLDFATAEREMPAAATAANDPEASFHQEFVRALFDRAVRAVREEFARSGRASQFAVFERYDLAAEEGLTYAQLAREAGATTTQVTNWLAQVRRRFREVALDDLRSLCGSEAEYQREARDIFGVELT